MVRHRLIQTELDKDPENHWMLTQLGVTLYEQRRYVEALQYFHAAERIVPDCPLTLWILAGTLDALGKHANAIRIYMLLLESNKTPAQDSCWESPEWADALKTDCVYRLGVCFQNLGKKRKAENCYRQFLKLISIGVESIYSIEDVKRQMRKLQGSGRSRGNGSEVRKAFRETIQAAGR